MSSSTERMAFIRNNLRAPEAEVVANTTNKKDVYIYVYIDDLYSVAISQVTLIQHLTGSAPMQSQIVANIARPAWTVQIGIHDGRCHIWCGHQQHCDHFLRCEIVPPLLQRVLCLPLFS